MRAAVINELKSDYVTYAKARGFSTSKIVYGEVLRNAFPSAITLFAQYCASVFGTSALIETVFSIQGLGYYLTEACESMDVYACNRIELMQLLRQLCSGGMAILFVTHDLRAASMADRILIMNDGQLVEAGTTEQIFNEPKEEYTKYLLSACTLERR